MAEHDQAAQRARCALSSLSADHRRAVVRAYYLGQTVADIAADEHTAETAVRCQLHDALFAMARALQENGTDQCP